MLFLTAVALECILYFKLDTDLFEKRKIQRAPIYRFTPEMLVRVGLDLVKPRTRNSIWLSPMGSRDFITWAGSHVDMRLNPGTLIWMQVAQKQLQLWLWDACSHWCVLEPRWCNDTCLVNCAKDCLACWGPLCFLLIQTSFSSASLVPWNTALVFRLGVCWIWKLFWIL